MLRSENNNYTLRVHMKTKYISTICFILTIGLSANIQAAEQEKYSNYNLSVIDNKELPALLMAKFVSGSGDNTIIINYSQTCAEKMAISVDLKIRDNVQQRIVMIKELIMKGKDIVIQRCPNVKYIAVGAYQNGTPKKYKGELTKTNNWKLTDVAFQLLKRGNAIVPLGPDETLLKVISLGPTILKITDSGKLTGRFATRFSIDGQITGDVKQYKQSTAYTVAGYFYTYGDAQKKCDKPKNGYAFWASFQWKVYAGSSGSGTYFSCHEPNTGGQSTKMVLRFDRSKGNPFKNLKLASNSPAKEKTTLTTKVDKHNSLEYLGFTASRFLLKDGNAKFYLAVNAAQSYTSYSIVAIHSVADDENIIDAKTKYYSNSYKVWGMQYSDEMIKHYTTSLLPRLSKLVTETSPREISHYTQNKRLFSTKQNQFNYPTSTISAPIYTQFTDYDASTRVAIPWTPKYLHLGEQVAHLGDNRANTLNEAIEKRTELDILFGMSDIEGRKYLKEKIKKKRAKKTRELMAKTKKTGIIYRDPSYWDEYNDRNKFQAIFNGEQSIESTNGFAWVYGTFISRYYRSCQKFIPPGSPGYDYTELTTITDSFSSSTYKSGSSKIRMKAKFFKQFEYYKERAVMPGFSSSIGLVFQLVMGSRDFNRIKFAKESLLYLRDDLSRLFNDGKCNSGFLMQFEENLYRLANNLDPVQKDNKMHQYLKNDK